MTLKFCYTYSMSMENNFQPLKKEVRAEIGPVIQEKKEDVKNLVETFEELYYVAGAVTAPSTFGRSEENPEGRERPFFLRAHRAELYQKIKSVSPEEREQVLKEANLRDAIAEQYLNQKDLKIHFSEYGDLSARMVDMNPPESLTTPENKNLPPIFLMPGIANDIEVVNNMACEIVMQGRRVVVVAQPESIKGHVTPEFADAVEKDATFGPHTAFFGEALKHIFKDTDSFELWGFSTGGAIAALLLHDPEFQKKVTNAVLIAPAGFVEQSNLSLNVGLLHDMALFKNKKSAHFIWGYGFKKNEQLALHDQVMSSLVKKITHANDNWKDARVADGGSIVLVSGGKDMVTKTTTMNTAFKQNPQIRVLDLPNAYHMSPQTEAQTIIPQILKEQ